MAGGAVSLRNRRAAVSFFDVPVECLLYATRGVVLRGSISTIQCNNIARALLAFNDEDRDGPYAALIHTAEIAITRPDLNLSILALNAVSQLTRQLLDEAA